ncbi:MAG: hypothetical protein LQ338_007422 [Usnochroma carphineum]|nr:MAG: hypothetical protein LQ338_007422 [Usnochroma carphineum]
MNSSCSIGDRTTQNKTALEDELLIERTTVAVKAYMSQPHFDSSHDFAHVQRVVALAEHILEVERSSDRITVCDATSVKLAALLHDVDDRKYAVPSDRSSVTDKKISGAKQMLLDQGCPSLLAASIQTIIESISYTTECRDPQLVQDTLESHPELAIVQDADRLDALGAVGIGRTFTYGGAKAKQRGLDGTLLHFDEKLLKLESMMKTEEGKRLARTRTDRLRQFQGWWKAETTSFEQK